MLPIERPSRSRLRGARGIVAPLTAQSHGGFPVVLRWRPTPLPLSGAPYAAPVTAAGGAE